MRSTELTNWLNVQVEERAWSFRELGRRSGLSSGTVSAVMTGRAFAGWDFCAGVAGALDVEPDYVFRLAGLLPRLPESVQEEKEVLSIVRRLPTATRSLVLTQLRALAGTSAPVHVLNEEQPDYLPEKGLERDLLTEFRRLPAELQEEAIREVERLGELRIRIIGAEEAREETPRGERNETEI